MATTKKFDLCVRLLHTMQPIHNSDYQIETDLIAHVTGLFESEKEDNPWWMVRSFQIEKVALQIGSFMGGYSDYAPWKLIPAKDVDQRLADEIKDEIVPQYASGRVVGFPIVPEMQITYYTPLPNVAAV